MTAATSSSRRATLQQVQNIFEPKVQSSRFSLPVQSSSFSLSSEFDPYLNSKDSKLKL